MEAEMPEWARAIVPALAKSRRKWECLPTEEQKRLLLAGGGALAQKEADDLMALIEEAE